jgi:hypothetical protein
VLHEGRITAEIPRERATEERVMFAATGSASDDEVSGTVGAGADRGFDG